MRTHDKYLTIFAVPESLEKQIKGRYVCLFQEAETVAWYVEPTLFDLHAALADDSVDWPFVERALLENGFWKLD